MGTSEDFQRMIAMKKVLCCAATLLLTTLLFAAPASKQEGNTTSADAKSEGTGGLTKELAEAYFKRMFGYNPSIEATVVRIAPSPIHGLSAVTVIFSTPRGQQEGTWYVSQDLKHAVIGELVPFGVHPFAEVREKLARGAFGPTAGPADAKLLMVEFADLECPACRAAAPVMDRLRKDFPQARFVFQNYPLPQHPWAARAAAFLDCIARRNNQQAFTFLDSIYTNQREIESAVRKTDEAGKTEIDNVALLGQLSHYAAEAGADSGAIGSCAATPETQGRIIRSEELGKSVDVNQTPTLFINGRRLTGIKEDEYDMVKTLVTYELEQAKAGN
jgi:protein-disulfide isomerase